MEAMDIDSAAITIPVIDTSSIGTNAVSVNQSNNNANRLNNSGSSSSSISSNSSGYGGSTTTTPTNNYESQSAPTTPVAIAEPLPNTTIATVTPFINEAVQTKVFNQLQEQQQTLQQHVPHLQKQQLHHHHHFHHQYKQHQSPLTPASLPTRQQYYNAYDYHQQQTHNLAATQAVGASPSFAVGSGVESYDNMLSYAGAASYKKSSDINYEREVNLKSTQTLYDNKTMANMQQQQQQQQHPQQFVGISNIQEKQGHFLNQRSSNISLISNTNTNNSHKPQAAATPFYAQPFAQQYSCSSYYDNFHTKVPMTLSEYHENYDQSYQQHKFYAAAKTQIKEAAGLTKPYATGSHTAQSFYNSNTTNHALTPPAYDKYLYSPNSLSAGGYHTNRVGNETPPEAKVYRKNSGNSSGWQWPLDNVIGNSRPLPPSSALQQPPMPSAGHIPTATVAPTHAASYLASNPTSLQREATYYYRNTAAAYQSPSLVHPNYQPQPYMSPPTANRNLWHTSHALHNERLSHSMPQNGTETSGPSHVTMHTTPYFPTNTSIVSNNRQSCCSQGFSPQNCYYPSRLTVPPPPPTALRSATTYMPSQQASSQHLTSLGSSSCKYGSVQDFTVSNKVKNPTDLFVGPTTYETQPSHGLHAHNYNYSTPVNGNFFSPSNHHQSNLTTGFNGPAMTQNQSVHPNDLNFPPNNFSNYLSNPLNRDTSYMNNHNMELPQPTFGSTSAKSALLDYRKHLQTPSQSQHQSHQPLVTDDYYLNTSRDHNQSADSSKALGNGETSLFQFDIEQQGTVNITFNPSSEVTSPYVSEDKTACDDVNKNLSLRDFIANWNDDEEDCAANEQIMANNSNHFVTKPTESADCDITITQELENSKKPPPEKSLNEEKKSSDNGLLLGNITTDLDASNQYVNLPDIIIDIEKSTNTINNLHPDNSKLQLNLDNFDVEQELDQLQLRKYGNSTEAESAMTFSENCDVALTDKATNLKVNENEQNLSKDLSVHTKDVTHTVLSPAITRPLLNDIEHSVEQQFLNDIESYDGSNSHHSNESAFEKEYETFINRISSEIIAKEFKRQDTSDQEFEQNVKDFSKFHKRKRKLKQIEDEDMKEEQVSKQQKIHTQPETKNNSNFPQVYTRKSRFRKSRKNILHRKRKPSSIFYRLMHPLKRSFHFHKAKPIRHYLNKLTDKILPLTKRKSPKSLSLGAMKARNKPESLKVLCIMAINTKEFRAILLKSAKSKLNEMTVPLNENVQNSFESVYQSETINTYAADEEHICTDPHCETCEVIKSLMEPQSYEFDVQTNQNLSDAVHNCDIEPIDLSSESCFRENLKTIQQIPIENEHSINQNSQNFSESSTFAKLTETNIESDVHESAVETPNLVEINNGTGTTSSFLAMNEDHAEVAEDEKQPALSYMPYKTEQSKKDEKSEVTDEHSALLSEIEFSKGDGVIEKPICKTNPQSRTKYYQATSFLNLDKKLQSSDESNESFFEECKTSAAKAANNQTDFASNIGDVVSSTNLKSPSLHEQANNLQSFDPANKELCASQHSQDSDQFVREKDSKKTQQNLEDDIAPSNYCKDGENSKDKEFNGSINHGSPGEKQHFNLHLEGIKESAKPTSFNESENNTSKVANDYCDSRLHIPHHRMENYEKIVDNTIEEMESESDSEETNSDTESESSTSRTSDSENDSSRSSVPSSDTYRRQRFHEHQVVARDESVKEKVAHGVKHQTQLALIKNSTYSDTHPEVAIHSESDVEDESDDEPSNITPTPKEYNLSHPIENDDDSTVSDAIDDNANQPIIIDHPGSPEDMEEKNDNGGINVTVGGKENFCHSNESNYNNSPYVTIHSEDSKQKLINKNQINDCKESDNELNLESNNKKLHVIATEEDKLPQYVERESDFPSCARNVDLTEDHIMSYPELEASKFQTTKENTSHLPQPIKSDDDHLSACDALHNEGNILIKDTLSKDWETESDDDESHANTMTRSMESANNASLRNSLYNQDLVENKSLRPVDEPMNNESIYSESELNESQKDNNFCQPVETNDDSNEQQNTTAYLRSENGIEYEKTSSRVNMSPSHVSKQNYATYEQNKPENVLENAERKLNKTLEAETNSQTNYEKVNSHNYDEINIGASNDFNLLQCGKNYNDSASCVSVHNEKTCQSLTREYDVLTSNDSNGESESESSSEYSSSDEEEDEDTANKDLKRKTFFHDLPEETNSKSNGTDCQNLIFKGDSVQRSIENEEEVKSSNIPLQTIEINGKSLCDTDAKDIENENHEKELKFNIFDDASCDMSFHDDTKTFPMSKENQTLQEQVENVTLRLADKCEENENRENKLNPSPLVEGEKHRKEVCVHFSEKCKNTTNFGESFKEETTEYAKELEEQCEIQSQDSYAKMPTKEIPEMAKISVITQDYMEEDHNEILSHSTETEKNVTLKISNNNLLEEISLSQVKPIPKTADELRNMVDRIEVSENISAVSKEEDHAMKSDDETSVMELTEKDMINLRKTSLVEAGEEELLSDDDGGEAIEQNLPTRNASDTGLQYKDVETNETISKCEKSEKIGDDNFHLHSYVKSCNEFLLPQNVRACSRSPLSEEKTTEHTNEKENKSQDKASSPINLDHLLQDNNRGQEDSGSSGSIIEDFRGFSEEKCFEEESQDFRGFDDKVSSNSMHAMNLDENASLSSSSQSTVSSSRSLHSFCTTKFLHSNFKTSISSEINELEALEKELSHRDWNSQNDDDQEKHMKNEINSQLIVNDNDMENIKKILQGDEIPPKENDQKNAEIAFVSKLSDLCRAALNSSLHLPNVCTTIESNPIDDENVMEKESTEVLLNRELTVEEALADMYRQAGILSDSEDSANEQDLGDESKSLDDKTTETQDVILINLQEILNSDNDIYVLQCDLNENILNIMETSTTSPPIQQQQQQQQQNEHIDENITERVETLLATQNESEIHIISSDSECEEVILLSDEGETETIPFITDHNLLDENVSLIHHEEIVPDNYKEFLREEFFKYLHEKYVQKNISKYYHANRILRKYKKRYSKQKK